MFIRRKMWERVQKDIYDLNELVQRLRRTVDGYDSLYTGHHCEGLRERLDGLESYMEVECEYLPASTPRVEYTKKVKS